VETTSKKVESIVQTTTTTNDDNNNNNILMIIEIGNEQDHHHHPRLSIRTLRPFNATAYPRCKKRCSASSPWIIVYDGSLSPPATLAVSICIAFLLETNQDLLMFLNAIQLRILWTMLVRTFSTLAIFC
jgi:hypothetical protein